MCEKVVWERLNAKDSNLGAEFHDLCGVVVEEMSP